MQLVVKLIKSIEDSLVHHWNETKKFQWKSYSIFEDNLLNDRSGIKVWKEYHRSATCQLLKHYGGVISEKICLPLHFGITESNLTVQWVSSSEILPPYVT